MRNPTWLALLASISLAACALPGAGDDDAGDDDAVVVTPPAPAPAAAYQLHTELDLSASTIVPATVYDAIELMRAFESSPGAAILDLAELAGVPAVDTIRAALPDFLESRLVGWIDARLAGTQLAAVVHEIVDLADTAFGQVELTSRLDVTDGVHALETVAVAVGGARAELAVEPVPGGLVATSADVAISTSGATLAIGEHRFGVRAGTAAWQALDAAIAARYGTDLAGAVAAAIDCDGLATAIASKCYFGQCVGHRAELLSACTGAVGYAVGQLEAEITSVDFDAVILHAGTATGVDADADGTAEALAGTWTAELDLGQGPRAVPATFTGAAE